MQDFLSKNISIKFNSIFISCFGKSNLMIRQVSDKAYHRLQFDIKALKIYNSEETGT
jgi:hypothetical protein